MGDRACHDVRRDDRGCCPGWRTTRVRRCGRSRLLSRRRVRQRRRRVKDAVPAPGPPLRPDGRHARASSAWPTRTTSRWSKTPARHTARPGRRARRPRRSRRGLQLLSGQEPRRVRRCRRAGHRRRADRGARAGAARARATREVSTRFRGVHGAPRHDPGAGAPAQAAASRGVERATAAGGRARIRPRWTASAICACHPCRRAASRSGTSTSFARGTRPRLARLSRGQRHRYWAPLPGAVATCRRRMRGSGTSGAVSPSPRASRSRRCRCRSSRASRMARSSMSSRSIESVLPRWVTLRRTTRPTV